MFTKYIKQFLITVLIVFLSGCNNLSLNSAAENPPLNAVCEGNWTQLDVSLPFKEFTLNDIHNMMPERKIGFTESLNFSALVGNVDDYPSVNDNREYTQITIFLYFKNIAASNLVIRKPQLAGFQGVIDESIYDVTINLFRKDGAMLQVMNNYNYLDEDEVTIEDFVKIGSGDVFCLPIVVKLPLIFTQNQEFSQLPNGSYVISVIYQNFMIGNRIPLNEPQPPNLTGVEGFEWDFSHIKEADLNAWVGKTDAIRVEFTISR